MPADDVLTPGEWSALLYQCPTQIKPLVYKLALFHGAAERPAPENCPLCGGHADQQGQTSLDYGHG